MKSLKMLSAVLFAISLSACQNLPEQPDHFQYGLNGMQLFGVHNRTGEERIHNVMDPEARGAQCLFIDDYLAIQEWIKEIKEIARMRCQ